MGQTRPCLPYNWISRHCGDRSEKSQPSHNWSSGMLDGWELGSLGIWHRASSLFDKLGKSHQSCTASHLLHINKPLGEMGRLWKTLGMGGKLFLMWLSHYFSPYTEWPLRYVRSLLNLLSRRMRYLSFRRLIKMALTGWWDNSVGRFFEPMCGRKEATPRRFSSDCHTVLWYTFMWTYTCDNNN